MKASADDPSRVATSNDTRDLRGTIVREETLSTYPSPVIEVVCRYCARRGRYRRDRLISVHGGGLPLDRFLRMISADCGFAQVRSGRKACLGPYIVPPETRAPQAPKECMLIKEKKLF